MRACHGAVPVTGDTVCEPLMVACSGRHGHQPVMVAWEAGTASFGDTGTVAAGWEGNPSIIASLLGNEVEQKPTDGSWNQSSCSFPVSLSFAWVIATSRNQVPRTQ